MICPYSSERIVAMAPDASSDMPSFACTSNLFPEWMAAALNRQDINQWAATRDIMTARA
jgi:hypothetical protein